MVLGEARPTALGTLPDSAACYAGVCLNDSDAAAPWTIASAAALRTEALVTETPLIQRARFEVGDLFVFQAPPHAFHHQQRRILNHLEDVASVPILKVEV